MSIRFVVPVALALVSVFTAPARPQAANVCPAIETVEIGKNRELRLSVELSHVFHICSRSRRVQ